jgi:hypothetical protein
MPRRRSRGMAPLILLVATMLISVIVNTHASSDKDFDFLEHSPRFFRRRVQDGTPTTAPSESYSVAKKDKKGEPTKAPSRSPRAGEPTRTPTPKGDKIIDGNNATPTTGSDMPIDEIVAGVGATSAAVMLVVAAKQRKKRTLSYRPGGARGHSGNKHSRGGRHSDMSSVPTRSSRIDMLRRGVAQTGQVVNKSFGDLQTRSNTRGILGGGGGGGSKRDTVLSERQALESLTEWEGNMFKREPRGARHKDGVNAFWQYASAGLPSTGRSPNSRGSSNYQWRSPTGAGSEQHSRGYLESTNTEKTWGTNSTGAGGGTRPVELPQHQQGLAALLVVAARLREDFKGQQEANEIMVAEQRVTNETTASQFLKRLYSICGQKTVGHAVEYARNRTSFRGAMMRAREKIIGFDNTSAHDCML